MVESKIEKLVKFSDFNEFGMTPEIKIGESVEDNLEI
jgi:hypothetical protein